MYGRAQCPWQHQLPKLQGVQPFAEVDLRTKGKSAAHQATRRYNTHSACEAVEPLQLSADRAAASRESGRIAVGRPPRACAARNGLGANCPRSDYLRDASHGKKWTCSTWCSKSIDFAREVKQCLRFHVSC